MPGESRKKTVAEIAENIYFLPFSLKYYSKLYPRLTVYSLIKNHKHKNPQIDTKASFHIHSRQSGQTS